MAPEGMFSMRAAIYLDDLTDEEGCLNVIAGSHHALFSQQLAEMDLRSMAEPRAVPGRVALRNRPGDVVFMNHKVYHSALSARPGRRALHINCVQNPERSNAEHMVGLQKTTHTPHTHAAHAHTHTQKHTHAHTQRTQAVQV